MTKARKTIDIATILDEANKYLSSDNPNITPDMRKGCASLLESILHDTGNYQGFNYIAWINGGCDRWRADGQPLDNSDYLGDETRRVYFGSTPRSLTKLTKEEHERAYPQSLEFMAGRKG